MKKIFNIPAIAESGIMLAIILIIDVSAAFAFRSLFPEGWATQLSFIFIVVLAFRRGLACAIIVNFSRAWIVVAISGTFFPPVATNAGEGIAISLLFDYIIGSIFSLVIAHLLVMKIKNIKLKFFLWIIIAITVSFAASFISGGLVWGMYAWDGWGAWIYSFVYNFSSSFASLVITIIFGAILLKVKPDLLKSKKEATWVS